MKAKSRRGSVVEMLESRRLLSTYYVSPAGSDSAAGSSAAPWQSLQKAADSVNAGDTVIARAGDYPGFNIGYSEPKSGTSSAPITFKADPGARVTTRNGKTPDGIDIEYADWIIIDGFTVINGVAPGGPGDISRAGIRAAWSNHVSLQNNIVSKAGTWGIYTSHCDDVLIQKNSSSYNNGDGAGWNHHGIYVANSAQRPIVRGNTIFGNVGNGLHINGDASQGGSGIASGALVENNVIYDNGINGGNAINCDGVQNSIFRNNLLYNNHIKGIDLYQVDAAAPSSNNIVVNNTIDMASDGAYGLVLRLGTNNTKVYNNILFGGSGGWYIASESLTGLASDNNITDGIFALGGSTNNLSSWQSASGQDRNSLTSTTAALFVNAAGGDYHLSSSSPAINRGTATQAPATDLEGNARPSGGAFDIGAYELKLGAPSSTPAAPTALGASATSFDKISLSWTDNASNESGFKIERATGTGAFTQIATVAANVTSYSDSGLSASTAYSYRVRATNSVGDSGYSNTGSATTQAMPTVPAAPSALTAMGTGISTVALSWKDNSNNETGFKIERGLLGLAYTQVGTVGAGVTSFTDRGLLPAVAYTYRVRAYNAAYDSAYSNTASATTAVLPAGIYTIFKPTDAPVNPSEPDDSAIEVGMKFRVDVAGSITGVRFYKGAGNTGTHVGNLWTSTGGNLASATFTGETASGWQQVNFATPVSVSANTTYVASYLAPVGHYADDDNAMGTTLGGGPVHGLANGVDGSNGVYHMGAGFPNVGYISTNYWVEPVFSTGSGVGLPTAPSGLGAAAVGPTQINLSWTDASTNETGFKIERSTNSGPFVQIATVAANVSSYSDSGLSPVTVYAYRVRATNGGGDSGYSNAATAVTGWAYPAAPSGLSATVRSSTRVDLGWTDNASNESGFRVERSSGAGAYLPIATLAANTTSYSDTSVVEGMTYTYRVLATNPAGDASSNVVTASIPQPIPAAPSGLVATAVTSSRIELAWTDNSYNADFFKIERSTDGVNWKPVVAYAGAEYLDSYLASNTTYYYRVAATNSGGASAWSNVSSARTLLAAPAAPSTLAIGNASATQLLMSWKDNDSTETGFKIERSTAGGAYAQIATVGASVTSYTNSGLSPNTSYSYRVRAYNAAGDSAYSNIASFKTLADTAAPTATVSAGNITTRGGTSYSFTVTYNDDVALNQSSIDSNDIIVTGPKSYSQKATLVSVSGPATSLVATYRIPSSGSSWDSSDNGSYTVSLQASQVYDAAGNAAAAKALGAFSVIL